MNMHFKEKEEELQRFRDQQDSRAGSAGLVVSHWRHRGGVTKNWRGSVGLGPGLAEHCERGPASPEGTGSSQ